MSVLELFAKSRRDRKQNEVTTRVKQVYGLRPGHPDFWERYQMEEAVMYAKKLAAGESQPRPLFWDQEQGATGEIELVEPQYQSFCRNAIDNLRTDLRRRTIGTVLRGRNEIYTRSFLFSLDDSCWRYYCGECKESIPGPRMTVQTTMGVKNPLKGVVCKSCGYEEPLNRVLFIESTALGSVFYRSFNVVDKHPKIHFHYNEVQVTCFYGKIQFTDVDHMYVFNLKTGQSYIMPVKVRGKRVSVKSNHIIKFTLGHDSPRHVFLLPDDDALLELVSTFEKYISCRPLKEYIVDFPDLVGPTMRRPSRMIPLSAFAYLNRFDGLTSKDMAWLMREYTPMHKKILYKLGTNWRRDVFRLRGFPKYKATKRAYTNGSLGMGDICHLLSVAKVIKDPDLQIRMVALSDQFDVSYTSAQEFLQALVDFHGEATTVAKLEAAVVRTTPSDWVRPREAFADAALLWSRLKSYGVTVPLKGNLVEIHDLLSFLANNIKSRNVLFSKPKAFEDMVSEVDGYTFQLATSAHYLKAAGKSLGGICVSVYDSYVLKGDIVIVTIHKDGYIYACLELDLKRRGRPMLVQAKHYRNVAMTPTFVKLVTKWLEANSFLQKEKLHDMSGVCEEEHYAVARRFEHEDIFLEEGGSAQEEATILLGLYSGIRRRQPRPPRPDWQFIDVVPLVDILFDDGEPQF